MGVLKKSAGAVAGTALAGVAGWAAYSRFVVKHDVPLPRAIEAAREEFRHPRTGKMSYYVTENGGAAPLVLIHSINAAASAYEMRPLFERFRSERAVYAPDLPGFGFSERTNRAYEPDYYAHAILTLLERIGGGAADVVALSLSSEFAALAAAWEPHRFRTLTLISPTGFASGKQAERNAMDRVFLSPVVGQALFDLLTTPASIRYFLGKSFVGPVDRGLAEYSYLTAHQRGARYAPAHFVAGRLFTPQASERIYARVKTPTLVLHGRPGYGNLRELPDFVAMRKHWRSAFVPGAGDMIHFEKPAETAALLESHWAAAGQAAVRQELQPEIL